MRSSLLWEVQATKISKKIKQISNFSFRDSSSCYGNTFLCWEFYVYLIIYILTHTKVYQKIANNEAKVEPGQQMYTRGLCYECEYFFFLFSRMLRTAMLEEIGQQLEWHQPFIRKCLFTGNGIFLGTVWRSRSLRRCTKRHRFKKKKNLKTQVRVFYFCCVLMNFVDALFLHLFLSHVFFWTV